MINYNPIPILFRVGFLTIHSFGFMLALSALVFLILVMKQSKKININPEKIYTLLISIVISALIGARIIYFFVNMAEFSSIADIFMLWKGGLSGIGALLGGVFGGFLFSKSQKIKFLKLADFIIPYVALSFAIGRIGCFLRGCCFGLPTNLPWGILYGGNSLAAQAGFTTTLHPTQLYLVLGNFIIFMILLNVNKNKFKTKIKKAKQYGSTFLLFLALFSLQRFLVDFIRYYPPSNYIGSFTVFQIAYSLVFIFAVLLLFFTIGKGNKRKL